VFPDDPSSIKLESEAALRDRTMIDQTNASPIRLWRILLWGAVAIVLVAPLVAMRFTDQVAWTAADFAAAAILLAGAGATFELLLRRTRNRAWRLAIGAMLLAAVMLIWAQGAVGILASRD
jgi:hypothetical protein